VCAADPKGYDPALIGSGPVTDGVEISAEQIAAQPSVMTEHSVRARPAAFPKRPDMCVNPAMNAPGSLSQLRSRSTLPRALPAADRCLIGNSHPTRSGRDPQNAATAKL
jgi:hypothetical protein